MLLTALLALVLVAVPANAEPLPKLFGIASDVQQRGAELPAFTAAAGEPPALYGLFWNLELAWPNEWAPAMLGELHREGATAYIELTTDDLPALASGRKDGALDAMVASIGPWLTERPDRHVLIAPLPEANLVEHPWSGDPVRFVQAFHRVREAFHRAGLGRAHVSFVFAVNGVSTKGQRYGDYYPGEGAVDVVAFNKLNRGAPWRDYAETFLEPLRLLDAVTTTKPILVGQTASTAVGGDRGAWLDDMFVGLEAQPRVLGAVYFNRAKDHDYRVLVDGRLDAAVVRGVRRWDGDRAWLTDGSLDAWVRARGGVASFRFADAAASPLREDVAWAAASGVTAGCGVDAFCPGRPVTRAQLATFLDRALGLPATTGDRFRDDAGVHEAAIERVAAAGITTGCAPDRFCPDAPVSRAQLAAMLDRALDLPATTGDRFRDDDGLAHEAAIERVAAAGITTGCAADRFCPGTAVTRAQVAAFLHRATS